MGPKRKAPSAKTSKDTPKMKTKKELEEEKKLTVEEETKKKLKEEKKKEQDKTKAKRQPAKKEPEEAVVEEEEEEEAEEEEEEEVKEEGEEEEEEYDEDSEECWTCGLQFDEIHSVMRNDPKKCCSICNKWSHYKCCAIGCALLASSDYICGKCIPISKRNHVF